MPNKPMQAIPGIPAARYVELNPVRANLVDRPEAYEWSSAKAHLEGRDDELVKVSPLLGLVGNCGPYSSSSKAGTEAKHTELSMVSPEFRNFAMKGRKISVINGGRNSVYL